MKHQKIKITIITIPVLTPLPEKQGLKPVTFAPSISANIVLTPLPEKQGLKLELDWTPAAIQQGINATSRKTRIET